MKQLFLIICVVALLHPAALSAAEIRNLASDQDGFRITVRYDLVGNPGEKQADVNVRLQIGGKAYKADQLSLAGDFGKAVKTGSGKRFTWDVLKDFPAGFEGKVVWDVTTTSGAPTAPIPAQGAVKTKDKASARTIKDMEFIFVKGGCFEMGDASGDDDPDERPLHEVCVNDFHLGKYEVTQGQWKEVMGTNPSNFSDCGDDCPVDNVTWIEVQDFISRLNSKSGKRYRLPTEAEWEYAARSGGKKETWAGTNNESELDDYAWHTGNSDGKPRPVGQKKPNGLGLYDMTGNVWEWCQDWKGVYRSDRLKNPTGPAAGAYRIRRGGSWDSNTYCLRSVYRNDLDPTHRHDYVGFRLLKTR